MRVNQFGLAAIFAVAGAAVAIGVAPIAVADECDPIASICQGPDVTQATDSSPNFAFPPDTDTGDTGGAPGELQLTDENPGIGGGTGHR